MVFRESTNLFKTNIIVLDLEMNQPSEKIIELGYVIGNPLTKEIHVRRSILVDPKEQLSQEIINLTGISQEMVDGKSSLRDAYNTMQNDVLEFNAINLIHQWGVPDAYLLKKQLNDPNLWKFGRRWIDIKALSQTYSLINGKNIYGGLRKMAAKIGIIVSKDEAHRADYDAQMSFLVYCRLANLFIINQSDKKINYSYRYVSGSIHNFSHAFLNKIIITFRDNIINEKFLNLFLNNDENFIHIKLLPDYSDNISIKNLYINKLINDFICNINYFFEKNSTSVYVLKIFELKVFLKDENLICDAEAVDDRGKKYFCSVKIENITQKLTST